MDHLYALFSILFALMLPSFCWAGGGGDGVPTPNDLVNRYLELVDGESYTLTGEVQIRSLAGDAQGVKFAVFVPDLRLHPWLGGQVRSKDPHYLLLGSNQLSGLSQWMPWDKKRVRIDAVAAGSVVKLGSGKSSTRQYVISLAVKTMAAVP